MLKIFIPGNIPSQIFDCARVMVAGKQVFIRMRFFVTSHMDERKAVQTVGRKRFLKGIAQLV